jgi:hypothetical protein
MQRKSLKKATPVSTKTPQTGAVEPIKQPQPLDAKVLQQVGGGLGYPRNNW